MEHIFIVNPKAGKKKHIRATVAQLNGIKDKSSEKISVIFTKNPGHASKLTEEIVATEKRTRIYACGGDGTINEVVQGAVNQKHIELGCIPVGSGNDFIKNFDVEEFRDIKAQMSAPSIPVDTILVCSDKHRRYCLNVVSLSWDSRVAIEVEDFKKIPLITGSAAYALSVLRELIKKEPTCVELEVDRKHMPAESYMIGMCGNGAYYGGGFMGAPYAKLNDGLFELVLVQEVSRREVIKLFPIYQKGEHLTEHAERFKDILTYKQGKHLKMTAKKGEIPVTVDGEGFYTKSLECTVVPESINLITPGESWKKIVI